MRRIKTLHCLLWSAIYSRLFLVVFSHGLMTDPRQRGALVVQNRLVPNLDEAAPFDPYAHFPAGSKDHSRGAGKTSVVRAAQNFWTPYEPLKKEFKWRAGVCGDEVGKEQEHLRGGKYFYPEDDPIRVRTYKKGETVDFESNIVTHHNGFLEFFICNIDKCGDDISSDCFKNGHCQQLLRASSYCDDGQSEDCGPIDEQYPGRWYLPCGPFPQGQILYGGHKGSMKYKLPEDLTCDHCVIQWYWTGANTCNPPGVVEYFEGENKPNWPDCRGQGGAIGGYTRVQRLCEGERFPEEYWQCADIRITSEDSKDAMTDESKDVADGGSSKSADKDSKDDESRNDNLGSFGGNTDMFPVDVGDIAKGVSGGFRRHGNEVSTQDDSFPAEGEVPEPSSEGSSVLKTPTPVVTPRATPAALQMPQDPTDSAFVPKKRSEQGSNFGSTFGPGLGSGLDFVR